MIQKLKKIANSWGGDLIQLSEKDFHGLGMISCRNNELSFKPAPYNPNQLGIFFDSKIVMHVPNVPWGHVIHEMGHCFACNEFPAKEEIDFFGWEYALAQMIDGDIDEWISHNHDYEINGENGKVEPIMSQRKNYIKKFIEERMIIAKQLGLIINDKPVSIRAD